MGSQFPDDPAALVIAPEDRANWISTLSVLSRATPRQLGQISDAAEKNAQSAARAMGRASVAAFNAWVTLMATPITWIASQACEAKGPSPV